MKGLVLAGRIKGEEAYWGFELKERPAGLVLVAGQRGAGRTTLLYHLYRQLMEHNGPRELGFVFINPDERDFAAWPKEYLYYPPAVTPTAGFELLERLRWLAFWRTAGSWGNRRRAIVVHIEGDDLMRKNQRRLERVLLLLGRHVKPANILVVYSSRDTTVGVTPGLLPLAPLCLMHARSEAAENDRIAGVEGHPWPQRPGERFGVSDFKIQPLLLLDAAYVRQLERWAADGFSQETWPEDPLKQWEVPGDTTEWAEVASDEGFSVADFFHDHAFLGLVAVIAAMMIMYLL